MEQVRPHSRSTAHTTTRNCRRLPRSAATHALCGRRSTMQSPNAPPREAATPQPLRAPFTKRAHLRGARQPRTSRAAATVTALKLGHRDPPLPPLSLPPALHAAASACRRVTTNRRPTIGGHAEVEELLRSSCLCAQSYATAAIRRDPPLPPSRPPASSYAPTPQRGNTPTTIPTPRSSSHLSHLSHLSHRGSRPFSNRYLASIRNSSPL